MKDTAVSSRNAMYLNALPYLNVLPLNEQKLDLWVLNALGAEVPVQLIAKLLKQESFEIGIDLTINEAQKPAEQERLQALQNSFEVLEKASEPLTVGYPLLMLEDAALGRDIAAPLFSWQLDLQQADDDRPEHWILAYHQQNSLEFNEIFKNYLITRFDLDWDSIMGRPEELKAKHLLAALDRLATAIQIPSETVPKLFMCPSPYAPAPTKNGIFWAGMIGQFEPKEQEDLDLPLNLQPRDKRTWYTRVDNLALDSAQQMALEAIYDSKHVRITGLEQTGKTRTIAALLPSVLADEGCALIISPEPHSLKNLKFQLDQFGLQELQPLILDDVHHLKAQLIAHLAGLPSRAKRLPKLDDKKYNLLLQQFLHLQEQLVNSYDAIQRPLLKGKDWTSAVGQFMHYHRKDGKQYLSRLLDTTLYEWTESEFDAILKEIEVHEPLFRKVKTLHHPLRALQDYIFSVHGQQWAEDYVNAQVRTHSRLLRDLYLNYTTFIDEYADDLRFHYEGHIKKLQQKVRKILRDLKVYQEVYGNNFDHIDSFTNARLRLLSVFSKRVQQIRAAKEKIYQQFDELREFYESKRFFEFELDTVRHYVNLSDIAEDLQEFSEAAGRFARKIPKIVQQKVRELSLTLPIKPHFKRKLESLEERIQLFFEKLHQSNLLDPTFEITSLKITEREAYLRDLLETLAELESSLDEFPDFYQWYRHWLRVEEKTQKVFQALVAVRPNDWKTAFKSWYWYHYLDKNYSIFLPNEELPVAEFVDKREDLRALMPVNSLLVTRERQMELLRLLRKELRIQLAQADRHFSSKTAEEIVETIGINNFTELVPVLMVTPEVAEALFPHKLALFDLLVLENAQLLDPKTGRNLTKLGAQQVVMGKPSDDTNNYLMKLENSVRFEHHQLSAVYSKNPSGNQLPKLTVKEESNFFRDELYSYLVQYLHEDRLDKKVTVKDGTLIDIIIKPKNNSGPSIAIIIDGWMKSLGKYDYKLVLHRAENLEKAGYVIYHVWSLEWWQSPDVAIQELVAYVLNWDKEYN